MKVTTKIKNFTIRPATEDDAPVILSLIKGLAEYEKLSHEVVATAEALRDTLFGARPVAEVILGDYNGEPVSFALFFHNYSTFLGRPGIYLEDLFVKPEMRRKGFGKVMLAFVAANKSAGLEAAFTRRWVVLIGGEKRLPCCHSKTCFLWGLLSFQISVVPRPSTT